MYFYMCLGFRYNNEVNVYVLDAMYVFMDGYIGKQKTDNKIDKYLWVLIGQKQQPFSLNPHVTPIYITFIVRECDFMVGDNKWNIKTSKQARMATKKARQGKQTRKFARKHFYFMAFDNIGGTYLFPCHASSNQMRIQSNWIEVFGISLVRLLPAPFLLSMFQFKSIHFQFASNIHIKSLYLFRYLPHTNDHPV